MKTPTFEEISFRAYNLWESRGRPDGQDAAIDCWLQAEHELWDDSHEREEREYESSDDDGEFQDEGEPVGGMPGETEITNMDRALPADERRQARSVRRGGSEGPPAFAGRASSELFVVVANRGHLRIYRADEETPELVSGFDVPGATKDYTDNDTDQAGRFPGSHGSGPGGSIDERLPMQEERQRRVAKESARHLVSFLKEHPDARWNFAAGPALHKLILDQLPPGMHAQLDRSLVKDLVNVPLPQLLEHFDLRRV